MEEIFNITKEQVQEICGYIRVGASFDVALAAADVRDDPYELWERMKEAEEGFLWEFHHAVKRAMAHFEIMQLQRIVSEGDAAGAKWILERALSRKWGRQEKPSRKRQELPEKTEREENNNDDDVLELYDVDVASLEIGEERDDIRDSRIEKKEG